MLQRYSLDTILKYQMSQNRQKYQNCQSCQKAFITCDLMMKPIKKRVISIWKNGPNNSKRGSAKNMPERWRFGARSLEKSGARDMLNNTRSGVNALPTVWKLRKNAEKPLKSKGKLGVNTLS